MIIAIEIGGTKLQIAIADTNLQELMHVLRFAVDMEFGAQGILNIINTTVQQIIDEGNEIAAIVVGFGGPVNAATGEVATSHQIGGWRGFKLSEWFSNRFSFPVFIENDANIAALAEAHFGAGKKYKTVLYVTLGSGVGGGFINNGKLYKGNLPGEVEIGQLNLDAKGATLESLCSGWALDKIIRNAVMQSAAKTPLVELTQHLSAHEAKFLYTAIEQNDLMALEIFNRYIANLCWGLSHAVHLFNPQVIIIGGGVSLIGKPLLSAIKQQLPALLASVLQPGPEIELAQTGEVVVLLGLLVLYQTEQKKSGKLI